MVGWMTVRAERKQRGGRYWVAYRRQRGQLRKVYLGRSSALTAISLERAARRLWGKEEHATNE